MIRSKIRKINPERSNKMILAVVAGLAVVLLAFFSLIIISGRQGGGRESMARTLAYLKNTEGLVEIRALDAEQRAVIVYNSDSKNAGNFKKIAYYAALRLSRHWPDCEVQLARNRAERIVYGVRFRGGALVSEGPIPARQGP
jgi:phage shock protein PspC (stress-responsive transcriptional regulator)